VNGGRWRKAAFGGPALVIDSNGHTAASSTVQMFVMPNPELLQSGTERYWLMGIFFIYFLCI
jgi:hypothetical protein